MSNSFVLIQKVVAFWLRSIHTHMCIRRLLWKPKWCFPEEPKYFWGEMFGHLSRTISCVCSSSKKARLLTDHFFQFGSLLVEVWLHGSNRVHHNGFKYLRIGLVGSRGPRILIGTVHGFPLSPRILNATVSNFHGFLTARFCTISTDSKRFFATQRGRRYEHRRKT